MRARIYQPARSAMTSGAAKTRRWVLDYLPAESRKVDPLMGWTGSGDMRQQVRMSFATREEAEQFARENGIDAVVILPNHRAENIRQGGYGENFANTRRNVWTH